MSPIDKEVLLENETETEPGYLRCFKRTFLVLVTISFLLMSASVFLLFTYYSQTTEAQTPANFDPVCKPTQFDNFVFAVRWLPSVCMNSKCVNETQNWVIHGLWPNYANGSWPQDCCKHWRFNINNISSLVTEMEELWPNVEPGKSYSSLWKHEWIKHGTCAFGRFQNEFDYFNTTLALNNDLHIDGDLDSAGIKPTDTKDNPVDAKVIHDALESKLNAKVHLECTNVKKSISKYPILTTINICVDKPNLKPIDCPQHEAGCGAQILYPSLNYPH